MNLMLKEVLAQQTSIVSELHVTETELLLLSKSKGKDSTHEENRKVVKLFGQRAELNREANVCTMLPTTSLDDSDVSSHDSYNCSSLSYDNGGFDSLQIGKAIFISSGKKMETNHDTPVPVPYRSKQSAVDIPLSEISSQHDWGSSRVIVHGSTLQNYVYPNPRLPSIDASQETEASKINLDRSTDNPRANYARSCLATPREMHMDTSISTDESELF
jgi:hypothetical protein